MWVVAWTFFPRSKEKTWLISSIEHRRQKSPYSKDHLEQTGKKTEILLSQNRSWISSAEEHSPISEVTNTTLEGEEFPFPVNMLKLSTKNRILFWFYPWLEVWVAMNIPVTCFILIWFVLSKWVAKWLFWNSSKQVILLRDGVCVKCQWVYILWPYDRDVWSLLFIKRCCWIMLEILIVLAISGCNLCMA